MTGQSTLNLHGNWRASLALSLRPLTLGLSLCNWFKSHSIAVFAKNRDFCHEKCVYMSIHNQLATFWNPMKGVDFCAQAKCRVECCEVKTCNLRSSDEVDMPQGRSRAERNMAKWKREKINFRHELKNISRIFKWLDSVDEREYELWKFLISFHSSIIF